MDENLVFLDETDVYRLIATLDKSLPTGKVIHEEIGLSWEVIADQVYHCSRNDVDKYADKLPRDFFKADDENAVDQVLSIWENAVDEYKKSIPHQKDRKSNVEEKWDKNRPKYERALSLYAITFRPAKDEIEFIKNETGNKSYVPTYETEYDLRDVLYDKIVRRNKKKLLRQMKPIIEKMPTEQFLKLFSFYDGYVTITDTPFVACISIMSEQAKRQLKEKVDGSTTNNAEQLQRSFSYAKALSDCNEMLNGDGVKLRGGFDSIWKRFEEKTNSVWYRYALRMAIMVQLFRIWEWSREDLELLMEYTFCLNDDKQREILNDAKALLSDGEIQPPHTFEKIAFFINENMTEQEKLEYSFALIMADTIYDV